MLEILPTWTKEKRRTQSIKRDFFASPEQAGGRWRGVYQSPHIGVKFVRAKDGKVAVFDTLEQAELAAGRAYKYATKDEPDPIRATRMIVVPGRKPFRTNSR